MHMTILMTQKIARVQMLRAGCSPEVMRQADENLWDLLLLQGLIHDEHPDLHESPQKLVWMQGQIGTMAWHRV